MIRERFGLGWAWLSTAGMAAAVIGSLITEFTGVAGIGELYGLSRGFTLPLSAAALLAVVATGSYRRVERTAIVIGLFELAFFAVAWAAHPSLGTLAKDAVDLPLGNHEFLYMVAAIIGATFNPWMIFYQQSAIADKKLRPDDLQAARWDTAFGAVLTQCLTGAVLVAAAATLASGGASAGLSSVGEISGALSPLLGENVGRAVFSAGVLGASLVAAIVCSLALAWGVGEVTGYKHSLEYHPFAAKWFYGVYAAAVVGAAALVGFVAGPRLAQHRGAGSERFPAAAGGRLPRRVGAESAAGAAASAGAVPRGLDRHFGRRDRRRALRRRLGADVAATPNSRNSSVSRR